MRGCTLCRTGTRGLTEPPASFPVPRSGRCLPGLVRPLQARGEPLPEDEDRGWPGPSALRIGKILSRRRSHGIGRKGKHLDTGTECELPSQSTEEASTVGFYQSCCLSPSLTVPLAAGTEYLSLQQACSLLAHRHCELWSFPFRAQGFKISILRSTKGNVE